MFVTCSIQSLKFCRSHHYVQRGLRLLQLLRLLHLLRLLCLLHLYVCKVCYTCYAFFDCYTYSLSRCIIKSVEDLLAGTLQFLLTRHQTITEFLNFPSCLSIFSPALLLVCKRCREEKSENLMVKTTLGTRISLGYEKKL